MPLDLDLGQQEARLCRSRGPARVAFVYEIFEIRRAVRLARGPFVVSFLRGG